MQQTQVNNNFRALFSFIINKLATIVTYRHIYKYIYVDDLFYILYIVGKFFADTRNNSNIRRRAPAGSLKS